ncbi:hypothetical protein [Streptomyces sp. NPDC059479]|uniref:hypothetical protein n=1 Tax=Streptomyces sp. NPDC059479 TaxID=3346848 RepID=UPI0036986B02
MTMPPSQAPGPNGSPPQQNPSAQPPHGLPYPQGQEPPQPYASYAGQGSWGQPPVGPPPRKKRTGLILGIVTGSIALAAALAYVGNKAGDAVASASKFPAAEYRLTVPKKLLDNEYKRLDDVTEQMNGEVKKEDLGDTLISRNVKTSLGMYAAADNSGGLSLAGMYGQFKNPALEVTSTLDGIQEGGLRELSPRKHVTPPGSDTDLTCTVMLSEEGSATFVVPVCAWGDENTVAGVAIFTLVDTEPDPDTIDLEAAARTTLKVREEIRRPIG